MKGSFFYNSSAEIAIKIESFALLNGNLVLVCCLRLALERISIQLNRFEVTA
jgi:hypothetical protein